MFCVKQGTEFFNLCIMLCLITSFNALPAASSISVQITRAMCPLVCDIRLIFCREWLNIFMKQTFFSFSRCQNETNGLIKIGGIHNCIFLQDNTLMSIYELSSWKYRSSMCGHRQVGPLGWSRNALGHNVNITSECGRCSSGRRILMARVQCHDKLLSVKTTELLVRDVIGWNVNSIVKHKSCNGQFYSVQLAVMISTASWWNEF